MPVPVLVGSWNTIDGLVLSVPLAARELTRAFWPGGLSIVVTQAPSLAWDLGDTDGTVMLRMPLHPSRSSCCARSVRWRCPVPMSGQPPATTVGRPGTSSATPSRCTSTAARCAAATASTIVDVTGEVPVILREGAISAERIGESSTWRSPNCGVHRERRTVARCRSRRRRTRRRGGGPPCDDRVADRQRVGVDAGVRAALGSEFGDKYAEDIPVTATTAAAKWSTNWRSWRSRAPASCSVRSTPTSSRCPGPWRTWRSTRRLPSPTTRPGAAASARRPPDTRLRANFSGRWFTPVSYELDMSDERIDYDKLRDTAMFYSHGSWWPGLGILAAHRLRRDAFDRRRGGLHPVGRRGPHRRARHRRHRTVAGRVRRRRHRLHPEDHAWTARRVILARRARRRAAPGGLPLRHRGGPNMAAIAAKAVAFAESATLRVPRLRAPCRRERRGTGQRPSSTADCGWSPEVPITIWPSST